MDRWSKFLRVLGKVRNLVDATRLWNWIDHQDAPEPYWAKMCEAVPWAFADPSWPNSILFVYKD